MNTRWALALVLTLFWAGTAMARTAPPDSSTSRFWQDKQLGLLYTYNIGIPTAEDGLDGLGYELPVISNNVYGFLRSPLGENSTLRTSLGYTSYAVKTYESQSGASVDGNVLGRFIRPGLAIETGTDEDASLTPRWIFSLEVPISLGADFEAVSRSFGSQSGTQRVALPSNTTATIGAIVGIGWGYSIKLGSHLRLNLESGVKYDVINRWDRMSVLEPAVGYRPVKTGYVKMHVLDFCFGGGLSYQFGKKRSKKANAQSTQRATGYYEYRRAAPVEAKKTEFGEEDSKVLAGVDTLYLPFVPRVKPTASREIKINRAIEGTVAISTDEGHGSGFFISEDGYVVTNDHVVDTSKTVKIKLYNNMILTGKVVRTNPTYDLALIKVDGAGFKPLAIGPADSVVIGSDVYIIGTPFDTELSSTVTKGILSAKRTYKDIKLIQTDAAISGGNSGGPMLNDAGVVVGVAFSKIKRTGVEGLGFCVAADQVFDALKLKIRRK